MKLSICSPSFSSILLALSLLLVVVPSLFCEQQQHNLALASADAAFGNPETPSGTSPRGQRGLQTGENTFEHAYDVECFLCRGPRDNTKILRTINQGSIVTLCVQLADESLREDGSVLIQSIRDFTWIKQSSAAPPSSSSASSSSTPSSPAEEIRITTNNTIPSHFNNRAADVIDWKVATAKERQQGYNLFGNHAKNNNTNISHAIETSEDDLVVVATQEAIKDGIPTNPLTAYNGCFSEGGSDESSNGDNSNDDASGAGGTFCSLTSVLKADFYSAVKGTVVGNGIVTLGFGTGGSREVAFRTGAGF